MNPIQAALATAECISDPIFLVQHEGLILGANSAAAALTNRPKSDLSGTPFSSLIQNPDLPEILTRWRRGRDPVPGSLTIKTADGPRQISCEASGIALEGRDSPGAVLIRCREHTGGVQRFQALEDKIQALAREIRERQRAEEASRQTEQRFRGIFEHAMDAMLIADNDALIVDANPAAFDLIGRAPDDLGHTHAFDLSGEGGESARKRWADFLQTGVQRGLFPIRRPDGAVREVEYSAVRDFVEGRHLAILRDVTERQREAAERERQAQALARSNKELEQFAYIASHDLQEPLRTIASFVELTRRRIGPALDPESSDYMTLVREAVHRLQRIILDLLEFSSLGRTARSFSIVNLDHTLAYLVRGLRTYIEDTNADVRVAPLPLVEGDPAQLSQLFRNLLENALKFRSAHPEIVISSERRGDEWIVSVCDNGPGIESQYFDRIFEPFRRLHGPEVPGSGIGLAICRRVAENHGGRIWVESEPGSGSVFRVALPAPSSKLAAQPI